MIGMEYALNFVYLLVKFFYNKILILTLIFNFCHFFPWLQGDIRNKDDLEKLFSKNKYVKLF